MIRHSWFIAIVLLAGCGSGESAGLFEFPASLGSEWTLERIEPVAAEKAPPGVQELGLRDARRGFYDGPGELTMVVYEMTTQSGAFELGQIWRSTEGMLAFPVGTALVLLESEMLSIAELNEIADLID